MIFMHMANLALDIRQLRKDARDGCVSTEQLLDIIEKQQHTIRRLEGQVGRFTTRLAQYEPEVRRETTTPVSTGETPALSYSVDAEHKRRRRRRRRKKSPGRR